MSLTEAVYWKRRVRIEEKRALGWTVEKIADETGFPEKFVARVFRDADDLTWPTEGFELRKAGGRP